MVRYLIVNADDYGFCQGVTNGILIGHRDGIVTSTSVMINMPDVSQAMSQALRESPKLGLGLHLNLTAGQPISDAKDIPSLLDGRGQFHDRESIIRHATGLNIKEAEQELRAQITRFGEILGRKPDHLDSHHHVTYLHEGLLDVMLILAQELNIPIRNPIPDGSNAGELGNKIAGDIADETMEKAIAKISGAQVSQSIRMPDHFISEFYGDRITLGDLLNILVTLPEGVTELMCHPGILDDDLIARSSYARPRGQELMALSHPAVREMITNQGITLMRYDQLQ
jgi:hypothetical protein